MITDLARLAPARSRPSGGFPAKPESLFRPCPRSVLAETLVLGAAQVSGHTHGASMKYQTNVGRDTTGLNPYLCKS